MNDDMQDIFSNFLAEGSEILEALDQHLKKLKAEPTNAELLNQIFRYMHSLKGSAGFLGFSRLVEVTHQGESLLNKLRKGEISVSPFIIDIILEAVDAVKLLHVDIRETGEDSHVDTALIVNKLTLTMDSAKDLKEVMANPHVAPERSRTIVNRVSAGSEVLPKMQEVASHTVQAASFNSSKASKKEEESTVRTERIQAEKVMRLVGELVLGRNRLMKLGFGLEKQYEANPLVRELGVTLAQLNLVTSDLQHAVMNTRMFPIWNMPSRFPSFTQDLSSRLGKSERANFIAENAKVNKSSANELNDPLLHLVESSMDYGLERGKEGKGKKKNTESSVRSAPGGEKNNIVIRIEDDGRGFAVVADEIHKLVEQTTIATKEIGDMVRQIQQDFKSVVTSRNQGMNQVSRGVEQTNKTGEALSEIQAMANEMAVMIQQIAGAAEEQSNATQQIAGDLEAMTETTRQTINGVAESAQSCHQLITLANDLRKTMSAFTV